jgi:PAS domain S-box-containing protein
MLVLGAAWFAAGAVALRFFPIDQGLAAVWPASGIGLGALLLFGWRLWPGIAFGSVALGLWNGLAPAENLALTAGNVIEALVGARLALWAAGGAIRLESLRGMLAVLVLGVAAGTSAGAIVCTLLMKAGGRETATILQLEPWAAWLGNAMGALIVAPVVLSWGRSSGRWTFPQRPAEAAALAAAAVLVGAFVFSHMPISVTANPVPYLLFPLFFWAAIRFGIREVTGLLLLLGAAAVAATCNAVGPFANGTPVENLVSLYLFLAVAAVPTLVLSALMAERTAAQQQLAANERNYRLIVENQSELVLRTRPDGTVAFASPSVLAFLDRDAAGVIGKPLSLPVHDDDRAILASALESLFGAAGECAAELRLQGSQGFRWFSWSGQREPAGEAAVMVGRDVTERRRAEEQAKSHLEQLAHVTRVSSMGEMATAIAHEVNQPLTAIQTFADAGMRLMQAGEANSASVQGALGRISAEAARAGEIIRRTRRFVRNEPAQPVELDINHAVADVARLAGPDAKEAGITLQLELARRPPCVLADPIQIQQVLLNLVRNAIEAINAAPNDSRRTIVVTTACSATDVEVSVRDTGAGLAFPDRLFEPFHTTKAAGMGIGLAISRSLVEAHGGALSAESPPGAGAVFRFTLPIAARRCDTHEAADLHR